MVDKNDVNLELLSYKLDKVIEAQEKFSVEIANFVKNFDERIKTLENLAAWGKGLIVGTGIISLASLIKSFFK